ncbi:MAG TPA: BatA domain-containing protein [Isosphaeraceae bacterium]|nr:BatA domain-containing protein [Isosphaeraceae bacterium]
MFTLLSPLLIWGTLLGVIPIIIHLLNRRRFRRVEWAPMRYLKLTIQRNRRRIQIEQLLLLLVRIALPVLLFVLLARPLLNATGLENWLGGSGRVSHVFLVDDSLSMGYAADSQVAFHRAREVVGALLAATRAGDRCTLVTTSASTAPVFQEVEGARREELAGDALSLPQTETHAAWPAVLAGVDGVLQSCTYPTRELTIITDLRKAGWDAGVSALASRWADQDIPVRVVDVGADEAANIAIESLTPLDRTILAGAESRWEAVVRNASPRLFTGSKGILRVDDRPTELVLPEIAPGQSVKVPLSVRFPGSGMHELSLQIADDPLPGDNQRWAAVPVKDSLLIRLVDGEPSTEPFGSEVDYMAAPLSIGVGDAEAWRVEVVQEDDFASPRLEPADVLVLANVAAPTADQANRVAALARAGMGLMIFTGPKLDTGLYNELLYRTGERLLPCSLKAQIDGEIRGLFVEQVRPSPFEKLLELKPSALERVTVRQIMGVDEGPEEAKVRVLARWNDAPRSPAVIERVVGNGRVLLWTTTADRAGSDWPIEPSFVLAVREAVRGTARPTALTNTVSAGEHPRRLIRSNQQVSNVFLSLPGSGEPVPLRAVPIEVSPKDELGPAVAVDLPDTRRAGLYRLALEEGPLGTQKDLFAANPDRRETDLDRIGEKDLKAMLEPLKVEVTRARGEGLDAFSATGQEVWHQLAWGLLALLILEPILATWVGRSR